MSDKSIKPDGPSAKRSKKSYFAMKEINDIQSHYNDTTGLLISHSLKRERGSKKEVNDLLSRFIEDKVDVDIDTDQKINENDDIDTQLAKELEQLNKKNYIFETGVECLLYCEVPYDAIDVVKNLFDGAKKEGVVMKETQRIVPLQKVVMASSMDKLIGAVNELLKTIDSTKHSTFAITYNCRLNSNYSRDQTIKTIADLMPKEWKVNLNNPDVTLMIEIFYRGLGISFVDKETMRKYHNFNVQQFLCPK